jgi:hypothetical protein
MQKEDKERQILINRLKTVRDPRERDQIIRLLARMEQYGPGKTQESAEDKRSVPAQVKGPVEARGPAETKAVKVSTGVGSMLGYTVPVIFMIFGLFYIVESLKDLMTGSGVDSIRIILGAGFFVMGLLSFLKERRKRSQAASYGAGRPEAKGPKILMRK